MVVKEAEQRVPELQAGASELGFDGNQKEFTQRVSARAPALPDVQLGGSRGGQVECAEVLARAGTMKGP